jgi:hypothetical protein
MVCANRFIASLVIVTLMPISTLAQNTSDSLDRIQKRLSTTSLLSNMRLDASFQSASCDVSRATGRDDANSRHGSARWFLG